MRQNKFIGKFQKKPKSIKIVAIGSIIGGLIAMFSVPMYLISITASRLLFGLCTVIFLLSGIMGRAMLVSEAIDKASEAEFKTSSGVPRKEWAKYFEAKHPYLTLITFCIPLWVMLFMMVGLVHFFPPIRASLIIISACGGFLVAVILFVWLEKKRKKCFEEFSAAHPEEADILCKADMGTERRKNDYGNLS